MGTRLRPTPQTNLVQTNVFVEVLSRDSADRRFQPADAHLARCVLDLVPIGTIRPRPERLSGATSLIRVWSTVMFSAKPHRIAARQWVVVSAPGSTARMGAGGLLVGILRWRLLGGTGGLVGTGGGHLARPW